MPTKPKVKTLTNNSVDVLNAIRNEASINYQHYVPVATDDPEVLRTIGATIMDNPSMQNEFLNALVNRIGRVIITSKLYSNPWANFKKGMLDFGETVEEIFTNIANAHTFDPEDAEETFAKREIPDVRSAFHVMNYQKYYKQTISRAQLRQAFLSFDGITNLIGSIIDAMYTAASYDEFLVMKYLLARRILKGQLYPVTAVEATDNASGLKFVTSVKTVSNDMTFNKTKYNLAGVYNNTPKDEQYVILSSAYDAFLDVNVLASAFNMDKVEFMGHRIITDGFGELDVERLKALFDGDNTFVEPTEEELEALNQIGAVIVDKDFFQIYDNLVNFDEFKNPEGMYWNYFYHVWKTFSVSPFSNGAMFLPTAPTVTSVTVTPATATLPVGGSVGLTATVKTTNFAPQGVNWTSSNDKVTVDKAGNVKVLTGATGTATITATSVFDTSKKGTATITIDAGA